MTTTETYAAHRMHSPYARRDGLCKHPTLTRKIILLFVLAVEGDYRSQWSTETADIFRAILVHVADSLINCKKIIRFRFNVSVVLAMLLLNNSFRMWHAIHIAYRLYRMSHASQATFDCEN